MPLRDRPPFRADHVGSLLRPPQLLQAREDFKEGRIDAAELRGIEDEAIRDVVGKQEAAGLRSATLSGWPSVTDSDVNRNSLGLVMWR